MKTLATWKWTPGIALVVVSLGLLGGSPSEGATLYGTARDNPGLVYEIDSDSMSTGILLDLALAGVDPISVLSPNGVALDPTAQRLYFASLLDPGSPADPSVSPSELYFIDLLEPTAVHWAGTLAGHASNGTIYEGKYLYIDQGTDFLREVTLSAEGSLVSDVVAADLLTGNTYLVVDDIAADCAGLVYISASITDRRGKAKGSLHGTYDLTTGALTEFGSGWGELAFGDDGALYGHNGVTGAFFVIDPVTGVTGAPSVLAEFETVNDLAGPSGCAPSEPEPPLEAQVSLCAAQSYEAGQIAIASDDENIYVTFVATEGWNLAKTHLAVECKASQIPRSTESGGPDLDGFAFQAVHDPLVQDYLYTVPLPDCGQSNVVYVAAHGVVYDMVNLQTAQVASGLIEAAVSDPDHMEVATKVTRRRRGQELLPGGFEDPAAEVEPPQPAVLAWEPCDTYPDCPATPTLDPSFWDSEIGRRPENPVPALAGADWVWEDYLSGDPVTGTVVRFERAFEIPGHAQTGDLYLTCRNAYEVYVNDQFVGMAQVPGSAEAGRGICSATSWQDSDLREACVSTTGWETVEGWLVGDLIRPGTNTLTIDAANEYFDIDDGNLAFGTEASNPAGCIFTLWTDYASDNDPAWGAGCGEGDGYLFEGGDGATFFSYQTRAPNGGGGGGDECGKVEQLYQWATGTATKAADWQFGNLNENNSTYFEDDSVPYYTHLTGLTLGNEYSLTIEWDTTKSSKHALDYLTTYDRNYPTFDPCDEAGLADCSTPTATYAIPGDPVMNSDVNWDAGAVQDAGDFTMWQGTIWGVSNYGYSFDPPTCSTSCYIGDTSTNITVYFTATDDEIVLSWGGHIATRMDWGIDNSAAFISGSPYHMRLIAYDDVTNEEVCSVGNTDRSLKASAVIFPATIRTVKDAVPDDPQDFEFSMTDGGDLPVKDAFGQPIGNFFLDDDDDSTLPSSEAFSVLPGTYKVTELLPVAGWDLADIVCDFDVQADPPKNGSFTTDIPAGLATIDIEEAEEITCTFINAIFAPNLTNGVVKDNDADGDLSFSDTETVPVEATYPVTVPYEFSITNGGGAATIPVLSSDTGNPGIFDDTHQSWLEANMVCTHGNASTFVFSDLPQPIGGGESITCTFSVTFDTAGLGSVTNIITVTAENETGSSSASDPSTVIFEQNPSILLAKSGTWDDNGTIVGVAEVGETISYSFTVTNDGNVTLTNVTLADTVGGVTISGGPIASLAVGASDSTTFTGSYVLTQVDVDAGSFFNTATATGECTAAGCPVTDPDDHTETLPQDPSILLAKTGSFQDESGDGFAQVGETISYSFTVTNDGNVTLTNVTLADTVGGVTISGGPIASLAVGASDSTTFTGSYVLTQVDVDAGSFFNTATATGECTAAGCPVTDPDDHTETLPQDPSILLAKTGSFQDESGDGFAQVGETISYSFTVTNDGNVTLTNVTLADTVGGVTISGGPIASLAVGASDSTTFTGSYVLTQVDVDAGSFFNTATATGECTAAGCPVTDPDDHTETLPQDPSILLAKTGSFQDESGDGFAQVGETISYSFTVTNDGNVTLTNVTLADTVGGVTISGGPIASLAVGASDSTTFTGSYVLTQVDVDAGSFFNTATATGECTAAGCPVTDPDDHTETLPQDPSILLAKTGSFQDESGDGFAQVGETISYSFTVTNDGNVTLTNVTLADTVGGVTISGGPIASLAVGASDSTTFTGSYVLTQVDVDAGSFFNTATATGECTAAGCPVTDPDDHTETLPQDPSILLAKTGSFQDESGDGFAQVGETISYSFTVTNDGNVTLTNVTLADTVGGVTISGGPIASLAVGASDSTTFTGSYVLTQVDVDAGSFFNTATATGECTAAGCPVTDPDDHTETLPQDPSILLAKTGSFQDESGDGFAQVGETISYSFTVTNDGNVTLTNVTLADTVGGVTISGGPIASLAVGASDSTTFTGSYVLTQVDVDAGSFFNTATATGECTAAGCPVTDPDDHTETLPQDPSILLAKTGSFQDESGDGFAQVGETISYSFTVTNDGNVTLTNVTLADTVGGVTISGGPIASLAVGASDSTTFTGSYVLTQVDVDAGSFFNTATATGECTAAGCPVTDPDDHTETLPQDPSILLAKTGSFQDESGDGFAQVGETISYSFTVTNDGNVTLTNVTLADTVGGVTISGGPIASLAVGASDSTTFTGSYVLTQVDVDAGSFFNTATATGECTAAGCPVTDPDDHTETLPQDPSILLAKTGSFQDESGDGFAQVGETISYSFTVTNDGNVTLTNVTLADTVGGVTISGGPIASLAVGASDSTTFTGSYVLTQVDVDAGSFFNTATATGECTAAGCPVTDPDDHTETLPQAPPLPNLCIPNEIFAVDDPDRRNSIFFRIDLGGGGASDCGNFHNGANFEGLESLHTVLYAASGETDTDFSGKDGFFYSVAADTCAVTEIGDTGFTDVEALAVHPINDTMWGFAEDEGLFTIDINGDPQELGTLIEASTTKIEALSWSLDGITLYGAGDSSLYTFECDSGSLVNDSCSGGGWQLVTNQLPGEIEGMDTVREGEHFVEGEDVLILGAHSDTLLYYWNVDTSSLMGTLSTKGHPDVEGVVVCKDD